MSHRRVLSLWFPRMGAERLLRQARMTQELPFAVVQDRGSAQKTGIEKYLESFGSITSGSWLKSNSLLEPLSNDPVMIDLLEVGSNPGIQAKLNPLFRNL